MHYGCAKMPLTQLEKKKNLAAANDQAQLLRHLRSLPQDKLADAVMWMALDSDLSQAPIRERALRELLDLQQQQTSQCSDKQKQMPSASALRCSPETALLTQLEKDQLLAASKDQAQLLRHLRSLPHDKLADAVTWMALDSADLSQAPIQEHALRELIDSMETGCTPSRPNKQIQAFATLSLPSSRPAAASVGATAIAPADDELGVLIGEYAMLASACFEW